MDNKEISARIKEILDTAGTRIRLELYLNLLIVDLGAKPVYTKEMHERGELPPHDIYVEGVCSDEGQPVEFERVRVIGHLHGLTVCANKLSHVIHYELDGIRPIQTQEEKDIDRLAAILNEATINVGSLKERYETCRANAKELLKHVTLKEGK